MPEDLDPGSASNGDDELEAMASAGDDVEYMFAQTSHETIYLSLFIQGRGALKRELTPRLRTHRANRRPKGKEATVGEGPGLVTRSNQELLPLTERARCSESAL